MLHCKSTIVSVSVVISWALAGTTHPNMLPLVVAVLRVPKQHANVVAHRSNRLIVLTCGHIMYVTIKSLLAVVSPPRFNTPSLLALIPQVLHNKKPMMEALASLQGRPHSHDLSIELKHSDLWSGMGPTHP